MMKRRWSGFYETTLDETLETIGAHYLIITCCTTSNCIESTIRDAAMRDYACLLPADCTAQRAAHGIPSTHESSLQAIARSFGWVTTSTDVVDAITSSGFKALNNEPLAVAILKPTYRNCARNRRHHYSELPTSAPDAYGEC